MTTPSDGRPEGQLPPHLDPRGPRRTSVPRVTGDYREAARGPAPRPAGPRPPAGGPPAGPPAERPSRRPRRRFARVLSWVALTMAVVILGLAGAGYVLVRHYNGNIDRLGGVFNIGGKRPAAAPHDAENVLLVGADSREGENGKGTGGKGFAPGIRSDTIILAHLYGKSNKALFVSFPRDSYVEIPAWTDPKTGVTHRARHGRINSAISSGGPSLLIATVERLSKIRIDHYVQIDFVGFKRMVDRLGGVDICLKKDVDDPKSQLRLSAGRHHVNGTTALAFARDRHSFAGQDLDRIKNQQQLIGSLIHKVLSAKTLLNPLKLNGFLNAATASLKVDEDLTFGQMKDIALRARGFESGNVLFTTVPIADASARINGASVVRLDESADERLFASLRRDEAPVDDAKAVAALKLTVRPSAVRVRVYNGSGVTGLGRRAFTELGGLGFTTTGTPTNRGTGAAVTTVLYGPTKADSARTLAAAIPGAVLQEEPTLHSTLEVVVGSGFAGTRPVKVTGTPSPTKSSAPKLRTAQDDVCSA
ncbi:MAG TPA: LCP family protein [Mycobacteriales bacterium]|nr:LCP family protein [Mycobacteriales bacterium]